MALLKWGQLLEESNYISLSSKLAEVALSRELCSTGATSVETLAQSGLKAFTRDLIQRLDLQHFQSSFACRRSGGLWDTDSNECERLLKMELYR